MNKGKARSTTWTGLSYVGVQLKVKDRTCYFENLIKLIETLINLQLMITS